MNKTRREFLGEAFDSCWENEIKLELESKYQGRKKKGNLKESFDRRPLFSIGQAAKCLNTSLMDFKKFLKVNEFLLQDEISEKDYSFSEESVEKEWAVIYRRNYVEKRQQVPLNSITREGFVSFGDLFCEERNK